MNPQKHLQQNNTNFLTKGVKIALLLFLFPIFLYGDAHIFVYHRFGDNRYKSTDTSIKELKKEFNFFKKNKYKVIKLETLVNAIKNKKNINNKWVVLTIDDNFQSFWTNGFKIFKQFHYPFTIFVYVQSAEKKYPDYMSWKELKEINKYGSVQYHSYAHPHLTYKSDKEIKADFVKGLKIFQKRMGFKPKYFAYPYGEFDARVQKIVKQFNFQAILNQNIGAISKNSNIYNLDRNALVGKTFLKRDLKYKDLRIKWIKPKVYPKNGILKEIMAKLYNKNIKNISYYLSGYGWHKANIKNGIVDINIDKKLIHQRNRIVIKVGNKIKTKLLIKDKYGIK